MQEDEYTIVVDVAADDVGEERRNIVWLKEVLTHITEFHGDPGPNISSENDRIEIFGCLFEDELFEHIANHTNLYTTQKLGSYTAFKPTNADDIKKFLAINLLIGIKKCPATRIIGHQILPSVTITYLLLCQGTDFRGFLVTST
jgi:hypothetical protein